MVSNEINSSVGGSLVLTTWFVVFGLLPTQRANGADQFTSKNPSGANSCVEGFSKSFQWQPALMESGLMLSFQHATRMVQAKTRRELGGPFFSDYFESVSTIHTWNDSNSILTNYVGHPMMGAVAGYIQIFNDPRGRCLKFEPSSRSYWKSRLKAMAWSAAYSTQFEIGPISEASIGNVGKQPPTMGVVDLVVTPIGGFAVTLLEDFVDRRFISQWERGASPTKARFYRVALNPCRSLANLLRFKRPSYRDARPPL
jgi:hypothetical protein